MSNRDKITFRIKHLEEELSFLTPMVEQRLKEYQDINSVLINKKNEYLDLLLKLKNMNQQGKEKYFYEYTY